MDYKEFIKNKVKSFKQSGFEPKNLNSNLFDFQKHIVKKACNAGKYAIFADCGLGKTLMQLEWANQVYNHTKKPVLILAPLAVSAQTINEGVKFGIEVSKYDRVSPIQIINYEQIDNLDITLFDGVVLDESSILKNFTGKLKNKIIDCFEDYSFKLACTATPAPNDPMELGNHSEFLNKMSRNEMLSMFFIHDGGETSKWRLKKHATNDFYSYISSWAVMLAKPGDIGFSNDGYDLPNLNFIEKKIITQNRTNDTLFNDKAVSATNFNQELRLTKIERMTKVVDLVNNSNENFIIWIKQNEEADYLKKLIPDAFEVRGSDKPEIKEQRLIDFANNKIRVLITKTKIAQFGMNFQNCNNQIFASLDFSFEGLYQAVRRSYRFGQENEVNIYIVTTDTMVNVVKSLNKKEKDFKIMQNKMNKLMNKVEYEHKSNYEKVELDDCTLYNADCVEAINLIEDQSVGLSVFSPPFAELYTYSDDHRDMGNSKDYKEFLQHFKYLVSELYRITKSGRNVAVHCMDLPIQKGKEGFIGLRDFSGMILNIFAELGFIYHSRITIWKDPVIEMQRTKALGLLHKQVKKDSTMSRVGIPDYVLIFRKDGDRDDPVKCEINVDTWQKIASPVWMDINYSNTLQGWRDGRDSKDEKHICPLQLDTIERLITLYSNKGDVVFTPFMGIGSEVYQSLKMDRKAIGIELKKSYFDLAVKNINELVKIKKQESIF